MKFRPILPRALALCLALALAPIPAWAEAPAQTEPQPVSTPAAAAQTEDQVLQEVTARVKARLGLDTEAYTSFQGWAEEDLLTGARWTLSWSGEGTELTIRADRAGKVYSLDRYEGSRTVAGWGVRGQLDIPRLPEDRSDAALAAAQAFLDKALDGAVERCALESQGVLSLRQSDYSFGGVLQLYGLPSPIRCQVTVRGSDLAVTSFWRSDSYGGYLPEIAHPTPAVDEAGARAALGSTLKMEARYVLDPGGKTAQVRYLPAAGDSYYVDGATGELVDLTQLYEKLAGGDRGGGMTTGSADMNAAAPEAGEAPAGDSLSQTEREGAAILEGAMDKAALDAAIQTAWPQMGLGEYTLSSAAYSVLDREDGGHDVSCRLTYTRQRGQVVQTKRVVADAKTGAVTRLTSTRSYRGEGKDSYAVSTSLTTAQATAQAALSPFAGGNAEKVALADSREAKAGESWEHRFSFQHTAGGYFYPDNYYTLGVDGTDGTLSRLEGEFDEAVVLQAPTQVVTPEEAAKTYLAAMAAPYRYLEVPVALDLAGEELAPLLRDAGYAYLSALKPGYVLAQPEGTTVEGVYAQSGQAAVFPQEEEDGRGLTYGDLTGHWAEGAALALAPFGVGFSGGALAPDRALTQADALGLLLSVEGGSYDLGNGEELDRLYRRAYTLGLLTPQERQPDRGVTRGELTRLILDGAGYGRLAGLEGIFRCDFSDAAALDPATLGYAALAQGLGLVRGGSDGAFAPDRPATRGEAVAMLYQYMK